MGQRYFEKIRSESAAKAAQGAEDLPNRAAIRSAVVAIEKEHLADLLESICLARTGKIVTDL